MERAIVAENTRTSSEGEIERKIDYGKGQRLSSYLSLKRLERRFESWEGRNFDFGEENKRKNGKDD